MRITDNRERERELTTLMYLETHMYLFSSVNTMTITLYTSTIHRQTSQGIAFGPTMAALAAFEG